MVDDFLNHFSKARKPFQLNLPLKIFLIILISFEIFSLIKWWQTEKKFYAIIAGIGFVIVFFCFYLVEKKIKKGIIDEKNKLKQIIKYWLKTKKGFNHSSQYKELAKLIKENKVKKKEWNFNTNSFFILFIPIWSGIVNILIIEYKMITFTLVNATVLTILGGYIIFLINSVITTVLNQNDTLKKYVFLLEEIALEESIREQQLK